MKVEHIVLNWVTNQDALLLLCMMGGKLKMIILGKNSDIIIRILERQSG